MITPSKQNDSTMKRLLSYLWPFTRKVATDHNGELFITLVNGTKTLNSKNANYSFGSLQEILEVGLSKIDLTSVNSVLLLGLGGGSVISSLRDKFTFDGQIVAVELDQKVIDIAKHEFLISSSRNLTIHKADAFEFVKQRKVQCDLIIVDLFFNNMVPPQFYSEEFCQNLSTILSKNGSILFNLGIFEIDNEKREAVVNYFQTKEEYKTSRYEKVAGTNSLMIAEKSL